MLKETFAVIAFAPMLAAFYSCSSDSNATTSTSAESAAVTAGAETDAQVDAFATHHASKVGSSPVQIDRNQSVGATKVSFTLDEISCEGCEAMCEEQLLAVDGVKSASPDKDTEIIEIELAEGNGVTFGQLIAAVEERGFLVQKIDTPSAE